VRTHAVGAARLLVVPTLALAVVVAFVPGRLAFAVRVYALILCAVVVGYALRSLRFAYPQAEPLRSARRRADAVPRPSTLARIEHETALGIASAFDLHHRFRPRLRALAGGLLATRRRMSLDGDLDAARAALGEDTWQLVRRDRRAPEDRLARGLPASEVRSVVESLERT
jgi:hypothetical protein